MKKYFALLLALVMTLSLFSCSVEQEAEGGEGEGEDEEVDIVIPDPPKSKYAVDNNVVAVTYGESKVDIYKTLLLNFNDYTIQTTYNGVTYTIEAYDYVVIMH